MNEYKFIHALQNAMQIAMCKRADKRHEYQKVFQGYVLKAHRH